MMGEQDPVVVDIPGIGAVEFPATMSTTEIAQQARRLMNQSKQQPEPAPAPAAPAGSTYPHARVGQAVKDFVGGAYETLKPWDRLSDIVTGPLTAARHPLLAVDLLWNAIKDAHAGQASQAVDAAKRVVSEPSMAEKARSASEAVGHGLAAVVPVVGPAAAAAGETIGRGEVARGLGQGAGLLAPMRAAKAKSAVEVPITPALSKANPVAAAAVEYGASKGVPIDAATATQRPIIRSLQKATADSLGGAGKAEDVQFRQAEALKRVGGELTERADPRGAVTPEQAGQSLREGVQRRISDKHAEATDAYGELRRIEQDPANAREVMPDPHTPAPDTPQYYSTQLEPSPDALFSEVLKDAIRQGYKGSKTDLRREFDAKLKSARAAKVSEADAMQASSPKKLLADIRNLGGINSQWMGQTEELGNLKQRISKNLGSGTANTLIKDGKGLGLDDLLQQLQQTGEYQHLKDTDDLYNAIESVALKADKGLPGGKKFDVENALKILGVEPGSRWWEGPAQPKTMALPVDLREVKASLRPVLDQMRRQLPITQQRSSPGLKAIENLVDGPDYAPLTQVDTDLGIIKSISRGADLPELRDISQGLAARAIKKLEAEVRATAAGAGPVATDALTTGRSATVAKYKAADVLKKLREEPVQAFQQAVYAKDAGIEQLRAVAKTAPDAMPKVGRAFLEDLMATATKDGKFDNAGTIHTKWSNLGPETKRLLFKDPAYTTELDNFFRLAKMVSENPNPSGTSRVMNATNLAMVPFTAAMSKLLYTRRGVQLLTKGLRAKVPVGGARGAAAIGTSSARPRPVTSPVPVVEQKREEERRAGG